MSIFRKNLILTTILAITVANVLVWYVVWQEGGREDMTVYFLDVGQGDAIFIEAPNGNQIIFDGGPNGKILGELGKILPFYDRTIDAIVVTNPDKDHFAGFIDVLDRYKVEKVFESGTKSGTKVYKEFAKAVVNEKAQKITALRGMKIVLDQERDVYIDILFPETGESAKSSNDGSLVARLVYGETEVMLMGDSTKLVEDRIVLLDGGRDELRSDILKVGHHGSKTSTSEDFLKKVAPRYAVISSGKNNRYGHPHKEVLEALKKFSVVVFRTDEVGTVRVVSDGKNLDLK